MNASDWLDPTAIATLVLAIVTVILASAVFRSIRENRRIRAEHRDSNRRRLAEVQHWINEIVTIKSECARMAGSPEEWRECEAKAGLAVATKEYIRMDAERIDSEFAAEVKLASNIDRLSSILEQHTGGSLSELAYQQEIEDLCTKSLTKISSIKAKLKL